MSPPRYTRRAALRIAAAGLVGSAAGCSAVTDDLSETTDPDDSTTPTSNSDTADSLDMGERATSDDGVSVTITDPQVRKIFFSPDEGTITHRYPAGEPYSQFIVASISTDGPDIDTLELDPVIDGNRRETQAYRRNASPGSEGYLAFQVSIADIASGAIEWAPETGDRYRWSLPGSLVEDLGLTPEFGVTEFSVPDSIPGGDPFTAAITVENTGDRDGRFLAVVLDEGASSVPLQSMFAMEIPVGETVSRELTGREVETDRDSVTGVLDWGIDERRATVSISD